MGLFTCPRRLKSLALCGDSLTIILKFIYSKFDTVSSKIRSNGRILAVKFKARSVETVYFRISIMEVNLDIKKLRQLDIGTRRIIVGMRHWQTTILGYSIKYAFDFVTQLLYLN